MSAPADEPPALPARECVREHRIMIRRILLEISPITYDLLVSVAAAAGKGQAEVLEVALLEYGERLRERRGLASPPGLSPAQWQALQAVAAGDPTGGRTRWRNTTRPVNPGTQRELAAAGARRRHRLAGRMGRSLAGEDLRLGRTRRRDGMRQPRRGRPLRCPGPRMAPLLPRLRRSPHGARVSPREVTPRRR